jgi:hypothetical protein
MLYFSKKIILMIFPSAERQKKGSIRMDMLSINNYYNKAKTKGVR